jgi:methionyl-tRNA formyltransferase
VARLVYLGTPEAGVLPLEALVHAGHDVALVVSRADARRGRGGATGPSPVKRAAVALGLAVTHDLDAALHVGAELGVLVAYGRIIRSSVLDALPMVNLHFSLLPRWRGAAPVERAVLAGDLSTGVSLMRVDAGLDTGPVVATRSVQIGEHEHVSSLTRRLSALGATMLADALADGALALAGGEPQHGEATVATKLAPKEYRLDWASPAADLERVVRLDGAWTTFRGERLHVNRARAHDELQSTPGDLEGRRASAIDSLPGTLDGTSVRTRAGTLELIEVQPAGKRPMSVGAWLRGVRIRPFETLGGEGAAR